MSNLPVDPREAASDFWGNSNLESKDFAIPRVTIGQATTSKGEPGKFNFNSGVSLDSMPGCKLIVPTKTRVLYNGDGPARCRSDNSYQPSQSISAPISDNCLTCFAAQWGTDDPAKIALADELRVQEGQRNKPLCAETYNLLMADKDWNLFFIAFQKSQLKIVSEKLFSRIKSMGLPGYMVSFDMDLQRITGGGKTYYSVVFDNFQETDDETGKEIYAQWSRRAQDELAKQHDTMDREKVVTPTDESPMPDYDEEVPF